MQWAAGVDRIFGVVASLDRPVLAGYFATFVNANTLAGFLVLGAAVLLGRFVESGRRWALVAAVVAAGGVVLSGSRGGVGALVVAAVVFGGLAWRGDGRARRVGVGAVMVAAVLGMVAVGLMPGWGADPSLDGRVEIGQASLGCLAEFWGLGSGRGTFEFVFPSCQRVPVAGTVTHPETIGLLLAVEWGVPVAVVAIGGGVAAGWQAVRRAARGSAGRWGACAGVVAVGAQQLVDFGFEAMGLSLPVAAMLGVALGEGEALGEGGAGSRWVRSRWLLGWGAVVLAAGVVAGGWAVRFGAEADVARIRAAVGPAAIETAAVAAAARHPADVQVALVAAARLAESGGELRSIVRWLNRAMVLAPVDGRAHLLAARVLRAAGRGAQAAGEMRWAFAELPWARGALVREVAAWGAGGSEAAASEVAAQMVAAVPREAVASLGEVLLSEGRAGEARAVMEVVLGEDPGVGAAHRLRGRACLVLGDRVCVEQSAAWLVAAGEGVAGHGLRARMSVAAGDDAAARAAVAAAMAGAGAGADALEGEQAAALRLAAEVAAALGDLAGAREAYGALWRRVAARPVEAAGVLAAWGRLERRMGDRARGAQMLRQAAALDPQFAEEAARE